MFKPSLLHSWDHSFSIISTIAFPHKKILFAGTQDSKILCFDLCTYNLIKTIQICDEDDEIRNRSSVLCLTKSRDEAYLFSAGTDSLVRVWSVGSVLKDLSISIQNVSIIYSLMDIGDIFSLKYLDSKQILVFGCQNASMLYVENFLTSQDQSLSYNNLEQLPQHRFDKFFDSTGPGGVTTSGSSPKGRKSPVLGGSAPSIIQVPSENTIAYAHNGFIYSISDVHEDRAYLTTQYKPFSDDPNASFFVSSAGDGKSKIWALSTISSQPQSVARVHFAAEIDNEGCVFCQFVEYPFLYCGLNDGVIKVWDLNTKQLIATFQTPDHADIMSVAVYKDHIFATNERGITRFYHSSSYHWNAHQGLVLSGEILRKQCTGNRFDRYVTGGNDGTLALWNIHSLVNDKESIEGSINTSDPHLSPLNENQKPWLLWERRQLDNDHMLETLQDLISFQTVSNNPTSQNTIDGRRCASFLQSLFTKFGSSMCDVIPVNNGGNPVVIAHFKANSSNMKRILWYGHYDIIAVDNPAGWDTSPFVLTCENGYLKGRGVSDNKGPLLAAIYSVAELFQKGELKNDIFFLIEGQEEAGSRGFQEIMKNSSIFKQKFNWILFSNSYWLDQKVPCLNYGLRGVINAEITVRSDEPDRHSGVDGGLHREPATDLINVVSKLVDDNGTVHIPGFYDPLKKISDEELSHFKDIISRADIDENITVEHLIAKWARPTLSITKMRTSGPGNSTVISQVVSLVVSIRLVPEQDVETIEQSLEHYIKKCFSELNSKNHLNMCILNDAEPWLGDPQNSCYKILKDEIQNTWGIEPLMIREGGSIPCVRFLERYLHAPAVQIPCGQSTDNAHLDNENLRIKNWYNMRNIMTKVFNKL